MRTPQLSLTRTRVLQWLNSVTKLCETKIQDLGTGATYCLLLLHFEPGLIPPPRLNSRNPLDCLSNLRRVQEGLSHIGATHIHVDVYRLSQLHYNDNWLLACKLHRFFHSDKYNTHMNKLFKSTSLCAPTPIKRVFDEDGEIRNHSIDQIQEIKKIVTNTQKNDRIKVMMLKRMLNLPEEEADQNEFLSESKQEEWIEIKEQ